LNTYKKGDDFRDAVYRIVLAAQKSNCLREKKVSGKAVDVYFEDTPPFDRRPIKYGVECKNLNKSLDRTKFDAIFITYLQVKHSGAIDKLIIITDKAIPTSVLDSVNDHDWIVVNTFDEFCSNFIGFRLYLSSLEGLFWDVGLEDYYVPVCDSLGSDAGEIVDTWIRSSDCRPQAILAGYVMGKTSFARSVASKYAKKCSDGEPTRVPIYLKLGDIFNEQSLEGLVCKYFASLNQVNGFTYELFKEFSRQGLFLVILDGFDEMKYAMSFSSFQQNIKEFNQLISDKSKVIILGRPNAFTSDNEKRSVLHGIRMLGDKEIRDASMPDYQELELAPFTRTQVNAFIPRYMEYLSREASTKGLSFVNDQFCKNRVNELLDPRFEELVSRPVHARMLTTIALSTELELAEFSTYDLYDHFIDLFLEREDTRSARKRIAPLKRREFISLVSWDSWR